MANRHHRDEAPVLRTAQELERPRATLAVEVSVKGAPRQGDHPVAIDDTKEHRTSAEVWGTCTFHESTARSPNRATTVRAHNWVVLGDLAPGQPWTYLPLASRRCFRQSQLPVGETFRTKTALAVDMLRQVQGRSQAPV